jgi:hypothetical protein
MHLKSLGPVIAYTFLLSTSFAQDAPMRREAAYCLVTGGTNGLGFLPGSPKQIHVGSYLDTTSYPGDQALYVVDYTGSNWSRGLVFVFFLRFKEGKQILRVENNATFVRKRSRIEFVETPLGGIWTQQHLEAAIDRIESSPKTTFGVPELKRNKANVGCESYALSQ